MAALVREHEDSSEVLAGVQHAAHLWAEDDLMKNALGGRLNDAEDVFEILKLPRLVLGVGCRWRQQPPQQVTQHLGDAPRAVAIAVKGVQLVRREGLSSQQLLQELETSMSQAARRLSRDHSTEAVAGYSPPEADTPAAPLEGTLAEELVLEPGQQVTWDEYSDLRLKLQQREMELKAAGQGTFREAATASLAVALGSAASELLCATTLKQPSAPDLQLLVLQDMQTLLVGCLQVAMPADTAPEDTTNSFTGFLPDGGMADGSELGVKQLVVQLLEQAHSRLSETYQWPVVSSTSSHQFKPPLRLKHLDKLAVQLPKAGAPTHPGLAAALSASFIKSLPASQTLELDQHCQTVLQWISSTTPALYITTDLCADVSLVPALLVALLQQQLFVSVAYSTVMEQLEGHRPVLPAGAQGVAGSTGAEADEQLLEQSWGPVLKNYIPVSVGGSPFQSSMGVWLEWLSYSWCRKALDELQAGWLSLGYWADLAQLAQQLAAKQQEAGGSGDLAAAGHTLLREKQSLYFVRQLLRGMPLVMAHTSGDFQLQQLAGSYTLTSPLPALQQLSQQKLAAAVAIHSSRLNRAKLLQEIRRQLQLIAQKLQAAGATNAEKAAWARRLQAILPSDDDQGTDARAASLQVFTEVASACAAERNVPNSVRVLLTNCWALSANAGDVAEQAAASSPSQFTYNYGTSQLYVLSNASDAEVAALMLGPAASSLDTLGSLEACQMALRQAATALLSHWCEFAHTRSIRVTSTSFRQLFLFVRLFRAVEPPELQSSLAAQVLAQFDTFEYGGAENKAFASSIFFPLLLGGWDSSLLSKELQHLRSVGASAAGISFVNVKFGLRAAKSLLVHTAQTVDGLQTDADSRRSIGSVNAEDPFTTLSAMKTAHQSLLQLLADKLTQVSTPTNNLACSELLELLPTLHKQEQLSNIICLAAYAGLTSVACLLAVAHQQQLLGETSAFTVVAYLGVEFDSEALQLPTLDQAQQLVTEIIQPAVRAVQELAAGSTEQQQLSRQVGKALPGLFGGLNVVVCSGHVNAAITQLPDLMQLQLQLDPGSIRRPASGVPLVLEIFGTVAAALAADSFIADGPVSLDKALKALAEMTLSTDANSMQLQQLLPKEQPLSLGLSLAITEAALSTKPAAAAAWAVCVLQAAEAPQQLLHKLSLQHLLALAAFLAVPEAARKDQAASAATSSPASLLLLVAGAIMQHVADSTAVPHPECCDVLQQLASWLLLAALPVGTKPKAAALMPFSQLLGWLEEQGVSSDQSGRVDVLSGLLQQMLAHSSGSGISKDQAAANHYWVALMQLVQDCLAASSAQVPAAVLAAITAAAVKMGHSQAIQPQLVLRLAAVKEVLQAVIQLVQQREEAATALLINGLLALCSDDVLHPEQLLEEIDHEQLDVFVPYLCSSGSTIALAEQLLQLDGPQLLLELYHRTRQAPGAAKPSLEGLVLDLGLIAAGRAGDWHECGAVLSSARTILSGGKGSSGSRRATSNMAGRQEWLPLLLEARAVLMAALVREHEDSSEVLAGVQHAAHLWAEVVKQARTGQHQVAAADQRPVKGTTSGKKKGQQDTAAGTNYLPLLSLPVLNSYLASCVDQYSHVAAVVSAAVRGELRLAASAAGVARGRTGWPADDLQCVLASAAAVWRAAGRTGLVVSMLDGLTAAGVTTLDNPQLAAEMEAAVEADDDLMTDGLGGRLKIVEDVFGICDIAKVGAGAVVPLGTAATSVGDTAIWSAWQQHAHQWQVLLAQAGGSRISSGSRQLHELTGPGAAPRAAAVAVKGVQLVRREGLSSQQLLQELEISMSQAARRLVAKTQ
eukprot:gene5776-6015_t